MPTALNGGRQAQTPSVPTPPTPNLPANATSAASKRPQAVYEGATRPSKSEASTFYGLDYFHSRLQSLGIAKENARDYGLDVDEHGNILQLVRRFDGSFIEFIPHRFRKKVERLLNHRSNYQPHLEMYDRLLAVTRYHPEYLKDHPKKSKYGNQFGERVRPLPTPSAIKAYNDKKLGGTIAFIEGYFKALALDRAGVESVAFTGISVYRICPALREYLLQRLPERIFIMYDNDALDVFKSSQTREGKAGQLSSKRNEDFANSARKFAAALFSLFSTVDHKCEIIFAMGNPHLGADAGAKDGFSKSKALEAAPKGVDDLIATYGSGPVTNDLLNFNFSPVFRESRFFAGFTLAKSTCHRKLNRLFLGNNYRHWRERLVNGTRAQRAATSPLSFGEGPGERTRAQRADNSGSLQAQRLPSTSGEAASTESAAFVYKNAHYTPISTGNLYDETITYQLETDPFAVDVPTDHLVIKHYLTDQRKALYQLIEDHDRLAINAPTGAGKTTFLVKFAKRRKARMVIAMPTINLAEQTAHSARAFLLTGNRDTAKIRAANDHHLIVCTYDTLHQVPDLWRRILVIDEAHNLINQYGQVYNGYKPFRAETLRNCVRRFPEAQKTILLSGTMPPLLCHAFDFHLVTFRRLENPTVRVFDVEADGSTPEALAKCLLTRLAEVLPPRAQRADNSGSHERSELPRLPSPAVGDLERGRGRGQRAQRADSSGSTNRLKDQQTNRLHVVFWNNTTQITRLKQTLVDLNYLTEDEIAIISRTHYNDGNAPDLDDIIRNQKINPRIKLLLCTCLISEGVNIKNTNVGRIYTVGLRCEDTFRQFIARFRKLKTVNVFSILEAERDLHPEFFLSGKIELLENLERADMQANHLRRRCEFYQSDYDETELPFLEQIQANQDYNYHNQLLNLVYRQGMPCLSAGEEPDTWLPDPLHVLAAIRGRKLATSNNCYFYTRLRAHNFSVFRVQQTPTDTLVEETINHQYETAKAERKDFRKLLLENLQSYPEEPINALYLLYAEKSNRHGLGNLRSLVPDLLDDCDGATGAQYLASHRIHLDDHAKSRILRFAKLHALGVQDKAPFLALSKADFHHEYQSALFHFEQLAADDPEHRKHILPAHKEEIRIKQKIVATLTSAASIHVPPLQPKAVRRRAGGEAHERSAQSRPPLSGEDLLKKLAPLLSVPRPQHLPPAPKYRKRETTFPTTQRSRDLPTLDILGLSPAKAINLLRRIMHVTVQGTGRYRTISLGSPFTAASPPSLAAAATSLLSNPLKVLQLLGT